MEESAPKRRRISPTVAQRASPGDNEAVAGAQPSRSARPNRTSRPSFASPTKSSMARYHSQILERRRSSSPTKSSPTRPPPPPPPRRPTTDPEQNASQEDEASDIERQDDDDDDASAHSSDQSPAHSPTSTRPGHVAVPRRSPARPSPRPLPAPTPQGEEDLNPFIGHTLRRSPETGVSMPRRKEPDLPPSVPDPVSSTPPRGIHSSSPSRWREKKRPTKQSPLKRPPLRPDDNEGMNPRGNPNPGSQQLPTEGRTAPTKGPGPNTNQATDVAAAAAAQEQASANLRNVPKHTPNTERRQTISNLRAEIRQLQADLKLVREESDRQHTARRSGRKVGLGNERDALRIIDQHLIGEQDEHKAAVPQTLARAALVGSSFRSFLQLRPEKAAMPVATEVLLGGIKSHHPVSMTAEEELTFLQLFSPFEITSTIEMLPASEKHMCRQRRLLTLRSRDSRYRGLFTARIEITTNMLSLSILDVNVQGLDPAAKPELQEFARKICEGECNRSMQRNIGILTWAMAEWVRVARRRAKLWYSLERELIKAGGLSGLSQASRQQGSRRQNFIEGSEEIPLKDLRRLMRKQSLIVACPVQGGAQGESSLRFRWRIEFTWTGDAISTTDVTLGVPGNWVQVDGSGALGKLPRLFRDLIGGGEEPEVAARSLSTLLAPAST